MSVRLSWTSPVLWFSLDFGLGGRRPDLQHGRVRAALVTALQNAGAIVVEPGTSAQKHLELAATLRRTGYPSAAGALANATFASLTLGLVPLRQPVTVELTVSSAHSNRCTANAPVSRAGEPVAVVALARTR
ncbi:hypothetical protein HRbin30_00918 [bacterium HR30]|nr:hypothetical protein HRbin30_00918 [bacterium HR30]